MRGVGERLIQCVVWCIWLKTTIFYAAQCLNCNLGHGFHLTKLNCANLNSQWVANLVLKQADKILLMTWKCHAHDCIWWLLCFYFLMQWFRNKITLSHLLPIQNTLLCQQKHLSCKAQNLRSISNTSIFTHIAVASCNTCNTWLEHLSGYSAWLH